VVASDCDSVSVYLCEFVCESVSVCVCVSVGFVVIDFVFVRVL